MSLEDGIVTLMLVMFVTVVLWLRIRGRQQQPGESDRDVVRTY